jgi:hypothetical protein
MTDPRKNDSLMPMLLLSIAISYSDYGTSFEEFSSILSSGFMTSRFEVKTMGCDWCYETLRSIAVYFYG